MGADEKHAATYHGGEYTPPVRDLRTSYVALRDKETTSLEEAREEFQRGIDRIRAEAKREALREAAAKLEDASVSPIWCWDKCGDPKCRDDIRVGAATEIQKWLRARANQYKEEPANGR